MYMLCPFFVIFLGIVEKSLILLYQGFFTMPFCYTKLNSRRTMKLVVHGVGSSVVNALCVIQVNKGGENMQNR